MNKQSQFKKALTLLLNFIYLALQVGAWSFVWYQYYSTNISRPFGYKGNWLVFAIYGMLMFFFTHLYGGYRIGYHKRGDIIYSNVLSIVFTNGFTYLQTCLLGAKVLNPGPFLGLGATQLLLAWAWASAATQLYMHLYPPHRMLMIYGGRQLTESLIFKMTSRPEKYDICEAVSIDEGLDAVIKKIEEYPAVIICDVPSSYRNELLKYCFKNSIRTYLTPKISDSIIRGAADIHLFDTPLLLCKNTGITGEQRFIKRAIDLAVAGLALIVTSPIMLATAVAIKLCDGGPVLYKQTRLTLNGKEFTLYKFRSLIVDAEKHTGPVLAGESDPRITPVGRWIRKVRIDELPQIWNILMGDMAVVGPRPERPEISAEYEREMPEFSFRLKVKAGLTGYAQILGKYNTTPYDKLKLDMIYIESYSCLLDLKLILMTIKTLFQRESTEGIAEGARTAAPPPAPVQPVEKEAATK